MVQVNIVIYQCVTPIILSLEWWSCNSVKIEIDCEIIPLTSAHETLRKKRNKNWEKFIVLCFSKARLSSQKSHVGSKVFEKKSASKIDGKKLNPL